MRWLIWSLLLVSCSTWSTQNQADADDCMRRCQEQRGHDRPREEVHPSQPDMALVPWHADTCAKRCSAAATGKQEPESPRPPDPFEPEPDPVTPVPPPSHGE